MSKRIYLITGASSETAMAYIRNLIKNSADAMVIGQYRKMNDELETLVNEAEASGFVLKLFRADLTNVEDINNLIDYVKGEVDCPTHILHCPAAKLHYRKIKGVEWKSVEDDFRIQVVSLGMLLSAFMPIMAKKRYGRIAVILSSVTCNEVPRFMLEYVTVKNALLGMVKSAASEYSDKNVYVSGLSPDMMETKLLSEVDEKIVALNAVNSSRGRNYTVDELIPYIEKIMAEESDCYNGVNIYPEN